VRLVEDLSHALNILLGAEGQSGSLVAVKANEGVVLEIKVAIPDGVQKMSEPIRRMYRCKLT
jgi:hypothetical protein